MSEMGQNVMGASFSVPAEQDFNTLGFQGSMQQVLQENVGSYVVVEFLMGTGTLTSRQGLLYYVGTQFLVLYDEVYLHYIVCDIFSVKFVTFLMPGCRTFDRTNGILTGMGTYQQPAPAPVNASDELETPASSPRENTATPSQAAYAHAVRRGFPGVSARNV